MADSENILYKFMLLLEIVTISSNLKMIWGSNSSRILLLMLMFVNYIISIFLILIRFV